MRAWIVTRDLHGLSGQPSDIDIDFGKDMNPNTGEKTLENSFSHISISNASKSRIAIMLLTSGQVSVAISSFVGTCTIKFQVGGMR